MHSAIVTNDEARRQHEEMRQTWGPAMAALSDKQRAFVLAYVEQGGRHAAQAAAKAGYSYKNANVLHVTGHRILHTPSVQEAIREETDRRLGSLQFVAAARLQELLENDLLKPNEMLKAILAVFDRTGHGPKSEQVITVEHKLNEQEMVTRIVGLCQEMSLDPKMILGDVKGLVIDAEYQVVSGNPDLDGLEDYL